MRFLVSRQRALCCLVVATAASGLTACGQTSGLAAPSWSLTGGRDAAPPPPAALSAEPRGTYRGGRDPVSNRAQPWTARSDRVEHVPLAPLPGSTPTATPANTGVTFAAGQPTTTSPAGASASAPATAAAVTAINGRPVVEVRKGDSLASIAASHKVSIANLMFANGLRDAYVAPGQKLVLPPR
jgi:LysM repeat protein